MVFIVDIFGGVYWVQVVMECLVIAFVTACHQYATIELNMIKFTPAVEVNALEKLLTLETKERGSKVSQHNVI